MQRLLFFLVLSSVFFLLDMYVWQGIKHLLRHSSSFLHTLVGIVYWTIPSLVVLLVVMRWVGWMPIPEKTWRLLVFGGFVLNFLPKFVAFVFVLMDDALRGGKFIAHQLLNDQPAPDAPKISRSDFLLKTGVIAAGVPLVGATFGILSGAHDYRVRHKTIYFPNLPKEFDGIRIGQISDIHSGSFFNKVAVEGGVQMLNREKPDLVFFTGDLVNDRAEEMKDYLQVFNQIKAPLGVHSILGNHDYGLYAQWGSEAQKLKNVQDVIKAHGQMGWQILLNQNRNITVEGASISVLGVENWGEGFIKVGDLQKTHAGTHESPFKILLSHDPSHWRAEVLPYYPDIDLTLSGHTHGMQFGIEIGDFQWSPAQYRYKEWGGLYAQEQQYIYVNRGFGYIGFPGRVGILPELTILELKKAPL